jgi:microcin C transport system permease protein
LTDEIAIGSSAAPQVTTHASPARRAWRRFRSNRLGYVSLVLFAILFGMSLLARGTGISR